MRPSIIESTTESAFIDATSFYKSATFLCILATAIFSISCSLKVSESERVDKFSVQPSSDIEQARQFELRNITLLDSPFKTAKEKDGQYLLSLDADRLLAPYWKEAGVEPEAENYGGWENTGLDGHSLGHYLTALSMMSATSDNPAYQQRADYIVSELAAIQDSIGTGYVSGIPGGKEIFNEIAGGTIDAQPFGLNDSWVPWYNIHKLYAGLRDAWLYADNEQAKEVLINLSDWSVDLSDNLSDEQFSQMLITEYGGMNEVMADVYAITGEQKYLDLAERFNDQQIFEPLARGEDRLAGLHANTQIPKIIGAAREYEFTGNDTLRQIASFFWKTVIENRTFANGGNSENEHFGELGTLDERLTKVTSESCNTYNMLKLTEHLMKWDPDNPAYAAYYEKALYNHILASQDPKTGMFCYFIPLNSGHFKTYSDPENSFWCCVGSGMENHTKYGKNIYLHTDEALYVNLFIPSELQWKEKGVTIRQETNFPNTESTTLTIQANSPKAFDIKIRWPEWAGTDFSVRVNGEEAAQLPANSAYATISRTWKDGDVIEVNLPMKLHLEPMKTAPQKAAIKYGPILLAGKLGTKGMNEEPIPYGGFEGFDGRWDHRRYEGMETVNAPSLIFDENQPVESWLTPVEGKQLHFQTRGAGSPQDVELAPFYDVNHERYAIYWDINPNSE